MKATAKVFAVTLAALSFAAASTVLAQPCAGTGPGAGMGPGMAQGMGPGKGMGMGMGQGMGPGMAGRMGGRMGGPESQEAAQARLSELKTALNITAAQEPAWNLYATVVTQQAQARDATRTQMMARMQDPNLTQAERLALHESMQKVRDVHLAERTEAIKGLQAVLTPEQRAIADQSLMPMQGRRMAHRGMGRW